MAVLRLMAVALPTLGHCRLQCAASWQWPCPRLATAPASMAALFGWCDLSNAGLAQDWPSSPARDQVCNLADGSLDEGCCPMRWTSQARCSIFREAGSALLGCPFSGATIALAGFKKHGLRGGLRLARVTGWG